MVNLIFVKALERSPVFTKIIANLLCAILPMISETNTVAKLLLCNYTAMHFVYLILH